LDHQGRFAFEPAIRHPGDGGNDEGHEARNRNARIRDHRDHCSRQNRRAGR
jgi:hypothetical protein